MIKISYSYTCLHLLPFILLCLILFLSKFPMVGYGYLIKCSYLGSAMQSFEEHLIVAYQYMGLELSVTGCILYGYIAGIVWVRAGLTG